MIFSLILVLPKIWYFRHCGKSRKYDIYDQRFYEIVFHAVWEISSSDENSDYENSDEESYSEKNCNEGRIKHHDNVFH